MNTHRALVLPLVAIFAAICGCARPAASQAAMPEYPPPTPRQHYGKTLLDEELLGTLVVEINAVCIGGKFENERLSTFCQCIGRSVVENIRALDLKYVEEVPHNIEGISANEAQQSFCLKEAGASIQER
jgi:hypothetical protein